MRVLLAGFGNVGRTVATHLRASAAEVGFPLSLVGVSDPRFGVVADPGGIDGQALADLAASAGSFAGWPANRPDLDTLGLIESVDADVLVELSFTDLTTGQPALSHVEAAIDRGLHVSTTNKGPIALALDALEERAAARGVTLAYEGTVMSGTPAVAVARDTVRPAGFRFAVGILNGTTNYILARVEEGLSLDEALGEAQSLGYAEADPTGDIDGHDAAAKLVILARILTGQVLAASDVATRSLTELDPDRVRSARSEGAAWKYVATLDPARADGADGPASVGLRKLPAGHPLVAVNGAANAVTFSTDLLGSITLSGPGAGRTETATAVLSDLMAIGRPTAGRPMASRPVGRRL